MDYADPRQTSGPDLQHLPPALWPSNDPARTNQAGPHRVSSRLISDYRLSAAITGDSELVTTQGPDRETELLALGPKGTIYSLQRTPSSDTGWEQESLGNDFQASGLALASTPTELMAFVIGPDQANPEIHYATRQPAGAWSQLKQIPLDPNLPPNLSAQRLVPARIKDSIELFAFLQGGPTGALTLWHIPWSTPGNWTNLGQVASTLGGAAVFKSAGEGILAFTRSEKNPSTFDLGLFPFPLQPQAKTIVAETSATKITVGSQANGYSGIFLYSESWAAGTHGLTFVDASAAKPTATVIDQKTVCAQILALSAGQSPLRLLYLNSHQELGVLHRQGEGWSDPFTLGTQFQSITTAQDSQGLSEIFGLDLSDQLWRMEEQSSKSDDPSSWRREPIDLPVDQISEVPSFATEITILSDQGNRLPNHPITLYAGEVIEVLIGGKSLVLGPKTGVTVSTDARSVVTAYTRAEALNTTTLRVSTGGDPEADVHIQPNAHLQTQLERLSPSDVSKLLPQKYKSDSAQVFKAIQAITTLVSTARQGPTSYRECLDPKKLPDIAFCFRVEGGRSTYVELTESEAESRRQTYLNAPQVDGLTDFWSWLGDLVEGAANDLESSFTFLVTAAADSLHVVVDFVVAGVTYVFQGVISAVEEALGLLESIFNSVAVFFAKLFGFFAWLIFDSAEDIWNTKNAIASTVRNVIPTVTSLNQKAIPKIEGFFQELEAGLDTYLEQVLKAVGSDTLGTANAESTATATESGDDLLSVIQDVSSIANWLLDKILSEVLDFEFPVLLTTIAQAGMDFLKQVEELIERSGDFLKQEYDNLTSFFEQVAAHPERLQQEALRALILSLRSLMHWAIENIEALVVALMEALSSVLEVFQSDVLDAEISGFFIEGLYNLMNPGEAETPTVLDLISLLCALPATVVFYAANGFPPITASLAEALEESKLTLPEYVRRHGLGADHPFRDQAAYVPGMLASILTIIPWMPWEVADDAMSQLDSPSDEASGFDLFKNVGMSIGVPLVILGLGHPNFADTCKKNIALIVTWSSYMGWVATQLLYTASQRGAKTITDDSVGVAFAGVAGGFLFVTSFITLMMQPEPGKLNNILLAVASPLPTTCKVLLLAENPYAKAALLVVDWAADTAVGFAGYKIASGNSESLAPTTAITTT
ncbi:MAG: hypothetical protein K0U98_26920 [Deltaproteobacteria bacterium]|nr:hypothetical protein [Deltaproteobacteria bacterium]